MNGDPKSRIRRPDTKPINTFSDEEKAAVVMQSDWEAMTEEEKARIVKNKPPPPTPLAGLHQTATPDDPTPVEHPLRAMAYEGEHEAAALTDHKTIETATIDLPDHARRAATQRSLKRPPQAAEDVTELSMRMKRRREWRFMAPIALGLGVVVVWFVEFRSGDESLPTVATGASEPSEAPVVAKAVETQVSRDAAKTAAATAHGQTDRTAVEPVQSKPAVTETKPATHQSANRVRSASPKTKPGTSSKSRPSSEATPTGEKPWSDP